MEQLTIGIGADNAGIALKSVITDDITTIQGLRLVDFGVDAATDTRPYPDIGLAVATAVAEGRIDRGLLICGTGIGMAITANKVAGVRATVAHDSYSVERSVLSNDCQILALGARVVGPELAKRLVREWMTYRFDPSSASAAKVAVLTAYEGEHQPGNGRPEQSC